MVCGSLDADIQDALRHARNFSETIHGAALLYNLMMARERAEDEWVVDYESRFALRPIYPTLAICSRLIR